MTGQMTIDDVADVHLHKAGVKRSPKVVATQFRAANPEAYEAIRWISEDDVAHGHTPSIAFCFEYLRRPWKWSPEVKAILARVTRPDGHVYTLDNSGRSYLVRMLEAESSVLRGKFRKCHCSVDKKTDTSNATPVVAPDDHTRPACYPCPDAAEHGAWICNRCEVATPHKEVEPPA